MEDETGCFKQLICGEFHEVNRFSKSISSLILKHKLHDCQQEIDTLNRFPNFAEREHFSIFRSFPKLRMNECQKPSPGSCNDGFTICPL